MYLPCKALRDSLSFLFSRRVSQGSNCPAFLCRPYAFYELQANANYFVSVIGGKFYFGGNNRGMYPLTLKRSPLSGSFPLTIISVVFLSLLRFVFIPYDMVMLVFSIFVRVGGGGGWGRGTAGEEEGGR